MIHFKNKAGFTLIETMMAMVIFALLITPLFIAQGSIVQAVSAVSLHMRRIFFAENFLLDARNESVDSQKFSLDKKLDDPVTRMKYQMTPVGKKSSLRNIEDLVSEKLTLEWDEYGKKKKDVIVSYVYKPQKSKKL